MKGGFTFPAISVRPAVACLAANVPTADPTPPQIFLITSNISQYSKCTAPHQINKICLLN